MKSLRILLTGATGFVGPCLLEAIRRSEKLSAAEIVVWEYDPEDTSGNNPNNVDIRRSDVVDAAIKALPPDLVVHLAAQSHVPTSFAKPELTWRINVLGTLNLFEALKAHAPDAGVLFIGSSEEYGKSFQCGKPLDETALLQPQNPYAASKAAADIMAGQYAAQGLRVIRMRPFNHIGIGQRSEFVVPAFASQIAKIEAGVQEPILKVGNLEAQRDFLDVRDVVGAYVAALEHMDSLPPGLALNVCSGVARKISEILEGLLSLSDSDIEVTQDLNRMRPSDTPLAVGDASASAEYLEWKPRISLEQTLKEILNEWRAKVGN
jgi:GDP-4-dehydro-6-deoxy-D-mannose reductase